MALTDKLTAIADAIRAKGSTTDMFIPAALFDAWSTETNWATYAKYMVAV